VTNEEILQKCLDETRRTQLQMFAISTRAMKGAGNLAEEVITRQGYTDVPSNRVGKNSFMYCANFFSNFTFSYFLVPLEQFRRIADSETLELIDEMTRKKEQEKREKAVLDAVKVSKLPRDERVMQLKNKQMKKILADFGIPVPSKAKHEDLQRLLMDNPKVPVEIVIPDLDTPVAAVSSALQSSKSTSATASAAAKSRIDPISAGTVVTATISNSGIDGGDDSSHDSGDDSGHDSGDDGGDDGGEVFGALAATAAATISRNRKRKGRAAVAAMLANLAAAPISDEINCGGGSGSGSGVVEEAVIAHVSAAADETATISGNGGGAAAASDAAVDCFAKCLVCSSVESLSTCPSCTESFCKDHTVCHGWIISCDNKDLQCDVSKSLKSVIFSGTSK